MNFLLITIDEGGGSEALEGDADKILAATELAMRSYPKPTVSRMRQALARMVVGDWDSWAQGYIIRIG